MAGCAVAESESSEAPDYGWGASDKEFATDPVIAVVTVKKDVTGVYLQINDDLSAEVSNPEVIDYKGETRCMVRYRLVSLSANPPRGQVVYVEWMEPVRTFAMTPGGSYNAPGQPGAVDIVRDSGMTVVEDGYLTLHYIIMAGGEHEHTFCLYQGVNPDDPYELELVHYPMGDPESYREEGIVAFRLDGLPDTFGAKVPLTVRYSPTGSDPAKVMTLRFDYRTRK